MGYLIDHLGAGGAEQLLAAYLPRMRDLGVACSVLVFNEAGGETLIREIRGLGFSVDVLGVHRMGDPRALPLTLQWLRRGRVQVVHSQLELAGFVGSLAGALLRIPSVTTLHAIAVPTNGRFGKMRERLVRWGLAHLCDRIVAVSDAARRHHVEVARLPAHKVLTIYNGIDRRRFVASDGARSAVREELGIAARAEVIATVAVLRRDKGIQHMVRALPAVARSVPDVVYLVVGDGPYREALRAEVAAAGVVDRVVFAGARRDVARVLAAADAFVLPSRSEALPTVLAEAMAAGVPVAATAVGGVPEMIRDGRNGILVGPGDEAALAAACVRLLTDVDTAARLAASGQEVAAERFDLARQAERLVVLYRQLRSAREWGRG